MYYNRYRYYAPELGRYVTQDPIELLGGVNTYAYPHAPTGWVDSLGLRCESPTKTLSEPMSPESEGLLSTISNFLQTIFTNSASAVAAAGEGTASGGVAIGVGALGEYKKAFLEYNQLGYPRYTSGLGRENINACIDKLIPIWDEIEDVDCAMRQIGSTCGGLL